MKSLHTASSRCTLCHPYGRENKKLRRELGTINEEVQGLSAAIEAKSTEAKKAQEAALDLFNIHKAVEESVSDAVASTSECFAEQKRAADDQMAACTTAMSEAVGRELTPYEGQADKAKTLAGNFDATMSKSVGELLSTCHHGFVQTAQAQDIS
ncbi:hypothetical protein MRX96_013707 [Rhipicephalus microplus]